MESSFMRYTAHLLGTDTTALYLKAHPFRVLRTQPNPIGAKSKVLSQSIEVQPKTYLVWPVGMILVRDTRWVLQNCPAGVTKHTSVCRHGEEGPSAPGN